MSKNNGLIKGGYILQPRAIEYSGAMKFPPGTREIWLYIIRRVQHKPFNKLKRGEGFFEYSKIQEALSWYIGYRRMVYSKTQVAKSLRRLREGNMIETTKATHGIVIKVCNYDYWQNPKHYEGNGEGHDEGNTKATGRLQYKQECKQEGNKNDNKNDKSPGKKQPGNDTWITPYKNVWEETYGGDFPVKKSVGAIKNVIKRHGEENALIGWKKYCEKTEAQYASAQGYAKIAGTFINKPKSPRGIIAP